MREGERGGGGEGNKGRKVVGGEGFEVGDGIPEGFAENPSGIPTPGPEAASNRPHQNRN